METIKDLLRENDKKTLEKLELERETMKRERVALDLVDVAIKEGGFTVDKTMCEMFYFSGFMVGGYSKERAFTVDTSEQKREAAQHITKLTKKLQHFVRNGLPGHHVGGWIDDTDTLIIEVSKRILSRKDAMEQAKKRNQAAIFNLATMKNERVE